MNKEWFQEHKLSFDEELPFGHQNRFEDKLRKRHKTGLSVKYWAYRVAAVIVVLFAVGSAIRYTASLSNANEQWVPTDDSMLAIEAVNFEQTQVYFQMRLDREQKQLNQLQGNTLDFEEFQNGLEELKLECKKLEVELAENPGNHRVINAIIKNYELRIELLKTIHQLIEKKQQKIETYEKNNA